MLKKYILSKSGTVLSATVIENEQVPQLIRIDSWLPTIDGNSLKKALRLG